MSADIVTTDDGHVLEAIRAMDEVRLHKVLVIPLLEAQGATNVEYLHGPSEKGKDFLYIHQDFHGHSRLEVCQFKNQPLSGRADATNAISVLAQLEQCRELEVRNPVTGQMEKPRGAVLLSTYEPEQKDVSGGGGLLARIRSKDCVFVGPTELVAKIKKFLPAFYDECLSPTAGVMRPIRRYVDMHHEAIAFDLTAKQLRSLADFFVNLSVTQAGQAMDDIARGVVRPKDVTSVLIHNAKYFDLRAQYHFVQANIQGFELFELAPTEPSDGRSRSSKSPKATSRQTRQENEWMHTRVKRLHFVTFLRKVQKHLEQADRTKAPKGQKSSDAVATNVLFVTACATFVDNLVSWLKDEDRPVSEEQTKGCCFDIPDVPAEALLKIDDNLCILGDAGAGKTSLARELARCALDKGNACIYFPCALIDRPGQNLRTRIEAFVVGLGSDRKRAKDLVASAKWIILDGCDEAATFGGQLEHEIVGLAFPRVLQASIKANDAQDPIIPEDIAPRLKFDRSKRVLIQSGPLSQIEYQRLIHLNEGSGYVVALRTLLAKSQTECPRIIITSREGLSLDECACFVRIRLAPFTDSQLDRFFAGWFSHSGESRKKIRVLFDEHPHIREICRTPIVATILAGVYEKGYGLPQSKTDIYSKRFDLLLERWDKARGVADRNRVNAHDKLTFLQRLALWMHENHRRIFHQVDALRIWRDGFSNHYPDIRIQDLLEELRICNSLVISEGKDAYSLGHLSYQEYLAARAVALGQRIKVLVDNFYDPRWQQVILFYAGFTGDISRLLGRIQRKKPLVEQGGFFDQLLAEARYTPARVRSFVQDAVIDDDGRQSATEQERRYSGRQEMEDET